MITKTISGAGNDWDNQLWSASGAYRTTYKSTSGYTPFQLVHSQEAIIGIEIEIPSLRVNLHNRMGNKVSLKYRLNQLESLDEK